MFFEPTSFKERTFSMQHINEWAGEIAGSYLNSGIAPTETLCKIAQSQELTPHQVSVLAGEANKEIHKHKYASAEDKYHAADFPLADAKAALGMLQADGGTTKVASQSFPEPVTNCEGPDMHAMWGVEHETMDKTASIRQDLKVASIRGSLLEQKCADKAVLAKYAAESAEMKLIKEARQSVLAGESSTERMKILGTLDHFVKCAGIAEGKLPLAKLAHVLGREGLLTPVHAKIAIEYLSKSADVTAPQELISEWLPAQVVNGEHPLYITLKTFKDCKDAEHNSGRDWKIIQDQLNVVRQKVRAL